MQVKFTDGHPLAGMLTMRFVIACIELAFEDDSDAALESARQLATVDGLIWG